MSIDPNHHIDINHRGMSHEFSFFPEHGAVRVIMKFSGGGAREPVTNEIKFGLAEFRSLVKVMKLVVAVFDEE